MYPNCSFLPNLETASRPESFSHQFLVFIISRVVCVCLCVCVCVCVCVLGVCVITWKLQVSELVG